MNRQEEKEDGKYAKMLCAILKNSLKYHPKNKSMSIYLPYPKPFEKDMLGSAGIKEDSWVTFSYGLQHMGTSVLDELQNLTFIISVQTLDAVLPGYEKTLLAWFLWERAFSKLMPSKQDWVYYSTPEGP